MAIHIDLSGKRILLTGSGSGIGRATAKICKSLGARVFLADTNEEALAAAVDEIDPVAGIVVDVSSEADCLRAIAKMEELSGGVDGLVHSAGITGNVQSSIGMDMGEWQKVVDINLRGTFLMCRAAGEAMIRQGSGAIVTIASVAGMGGWPRRPAYSPAKAGVIAITHNLACEWGHLGIRVNAVAPGFIRTPMFERAISSGAYDPSRPERRTPMARLGQPDEVGNVIAFLLSDLASYMTGAIVPIDGGVTAYIGAGDVQTF